jgi:hypothetical protein
MGQFGSLARRYLLDRALNGRRGRRSHGPVPQPGYGRPRRGRFGLWGPVPYYSRRTRRGSDVSVGGCGCCLPIPLVVTLTTAGAMRALWRRLR